MPDLADAARHVAAARERLDAARRETARARAAFDAEATDAACAAVLEAEDAERVARAWLQRAERLRGRASLAMLERSAETPGSDLWLVQLTIEHMQRADLRRPGETVNQAAARLSREVRARRAEILLSRPPRNAG